MKIALAQINTTVADFEGTVARVREQTARARQQGAELVIFPEMTTTGYPPRDLVESRYFVEQNLKALEEIARESKGIEIIVGYVENNTEPGGKPLHNASALCRDGKIVERYFKKLLPTYDVFDEGRYFEPGRLSGLWTIADHRVGISICEDSWNDKSFWEKHLYPQDPIAEEASHGAGILINIAASPFSVGKPQLRRRMMQAIAKKHRRPVVYVNLVGGNDELVFDGRSLVVNENGEIVLEAKAYEEDLLMVDLSKLAPKALSPIDDLESILSTLQLGLKDYVRKCGFQKVVLGLSGGIDSALTAAIACEALGPKNVLGVLMPSPYSSPGSIEDSLELAKNLGIPTKKYPIDSVYEAYRKLFHRSGEPDLADENVQARIRGNLLMELSNREGYLVLSTGNKSELAVGYCTLYGDMSGGLALISDIPKTMVYDLAKRMNSRRSVIPEKTMTKPPSAELKLNQTDQDSLPPYETLDPILKAAVEEHKSESEIVAMGYEESVVQKILMLIAKNEYKRRQAAPGIKVTSKAFGIGRRFPIARKI